MCYIILTLTCIYLYNIMNMRVCLHVLMVLISSYEPCVVAFVHLVRSQSPSRVLVCLMRVGMCWWSLLRTLQSLSRCACAHACCLWYVFPSVFVCVCVCTLHTCPFPFSYRAPYCACFLLHKRTYLSPPPSFLLPSAALQDNRARVEHILLGPLHCH